MENNKLTKKQKEAIGLLSIGTFLEYFDLMLYVHMSVLLNELFFPKTDHLTTQLLSATTFCLTYVLRPIGGIVMGKIGDIMGRKFTIMITTFTMAISCIIMANLPTYAEIGIIATIIMIVCRMLQGFSSLGEIVGAELYLSEMLKNPYKCIFSGMIGVSSKIGGFFALAIASFALSIGLNWRIAFVVGAIIAIIGLIARTRLRETPEFVDYKRRLIKQNISNKTQIRQYSKERIDKKFALAYFFTEFISPLCFFFAYIFLGDYMKTTLGLSPKDVINQNLKVSIIIAFSAFFISILAKKLHPVRTALFSTFIFSVTLIFIPYLLGSGINLNMLLFIQCIVFCLSVPASGTLDAIQYKYFPVDRRFTMLAVIFGIANPISTCLVAFSLIPIVNYLGYYGLWIVFIPMITGYLWALNYTKKLEIKREAYYNYPDENILEPDTAIKEEDYEYNLGDEYELFKNNCEYKSELLNKLNIIATNKNRQLNIKLIEKAITFAKKWHGTQMRKTGDKPYYFHPLAVAGMVAEYYCKTDVIVAAILHDVVEDSKCTVEI